VKKKSVTSALWTADVMEDCSVEPAFVTTVSSPRFDGLLHISARPDTPLGAQPADFFCYTEQGHSLESHETAPAEEIALAKLRGHVRQTASHQAYQREWLLTNGSVLIIVTYTSHAAPKAEEADEVNAIVHSLRPANAMI
jgi:hypothetical protein